MTIETQKGEEKFRALFESAKDGILQLSTTGKVVALNASFARMHGYSVEEMLTMNLKDLDTPASAQLAPARIQRMFAGEPMSFEVEHYCKNGQTIPLEVSANMVIIGEEKYILGFHRDITERKQLEEERLKTHKLESIGTLAGGIAHDFNNLLQGVFGYIAMARMTHDRKEKSLAMLEQAEKALHLAVNLTSQLLTFSKGGKPVKKLIRLPHVLENAMKFALSGSNTDYRLDIASDLWPVSADEGQVAQVIQNIVLNANEAMADQDSVNVMAKNEILPAADPRLPQGGRFVRIDIQDSGSGISAQNITKIFDPYFTTKQRGSGLGLATSYSIIKNHGGVIEVRSELNKGTTFTIYLPAAEGERRLAEPLASPVVVVAPKGRILLMDDEDLVRGVATEMISALGHEVECAEDGDKTIELFRRAREAGNPFDLLILDLTVKGGMGGEEALQKILEIDPGVKAVVCSGYADNQVVAHFRDYGFSAFLNKPYKLEALQECLNKLTI